MGGSFFWQPPVCIMDQGYDIEQMCTPDQDDLDVLSPTILNSSEESEEESEFTEDEELTVFPL